MYRARQNKVAPLKNFAIFSRIERYDVKTLQLFCKSGINFVEINETYLNQN